MTDICEIVSEGYCSNRTTYRAIRRFVDLSLLTLEGTGRNRLVKPTSELMEFWRELSNEVPMVFKTSEESTACSTTFGLIADGVIPTKCHNNADAKCA